MDDNRPADTTEEQAKPEAPEILTKPEQKTDNIKRGYIRSNRYRNKRRNLSNPELAKMIDLEAKGVSRSDIADIMHVDKSTVTKAMQRFKPMFKELPNVKEYQSVKSDVLNAAELVAIKSLVKEERLNEARLSEVAKMFEVLYKAGRLERGQSTQNIITKSFVDVNLDDL